MLSNASVLARDVAKRVIKIASSRSEKMWSTSLK